MIPQRASVKHLNCDGVIYLFIYFLFRQNGFNFNSENNDEPYGHFLIILQRRKNPIRINRK